MTTNIGNTDRAIRLIVPVVIILLSVFKIITGILDLILLFAAAVLALTSMSGVCPLYTLFGINTCRKKHPLNDGR